MNDGVPASKIVRKTPRSSARTTRQRSLTDPISSSIEGTTPPNGNMIDNLRFVDKMLDGIMAKVDIVSRYFTVAQHLLICCTIYYFIIIYRSTKRLARPENSRAETTWRHAKYDLNENEMRIKNWF